MALVGITLGTITNLDPILAYIGASNISQAPIFYLFVRKK
jgi:hypothetical protein